MARRGRGPVPPREIAWIDQVLQTGMPVAKKQALQRLCGLLRRGFWVASPRSLKGLILLSLNDEDEKVKRWSFNALAQMGEPSDVPFMLTAWRDSRSDPAIFEAGLTALAKILPKEELLVVLKSSGIDLDPPALLALGQQSASFAKELSELRLNIESVTEAELRSATLLIGLQKAPETLFSDRYPVSDILGDLNTHGDPIVAQYSFWATVEHPGLGIQNIRVDPANFSSLPPNVQGWAY